MAGWQPAWQILVAFNNAVFDDPALISTVATPPGTLGGHNVWTDITADVRDGVDTNRGKQHELDEYQTGTLALTLDNRAGRYDPWNTAGPYAGLVIPGKPVQLRATDPNTSTVTGLFTGVTDVWTTGWADPRYGTVQLSCVDWFAYLTNAYPNSTYYATVVAADGPFAFWRLNDPTGSSTVADSTGGGNTGTVFGKPTFGTAAGPAVADVATAAILGTVGSAAAHIRTPAVVNPVGLSFSVEAWVQFTGPPTTRSFVWVQPNTDLSIWVDASTGNAGWSWGFDNPTTTNVTDGNWHHLAMVSTFTPGTTTLYVDGVNRSSSANGTAFTDTQSLIGAVNQYVATCQGNVADIALYSSALSAAQVANHYTAAGLYAPAESCAARLTRVATAVATPTAHAALDTGKSPIQAQAGSLLTTTALSHMQLVEQTEDGGLYVNGAGQLRFMSRDTIFTNTTPTVTFGDGGASEIPFELGPTIATDTLDQYVQTLIARNGGQTQTASSGALGKQYQQTGLLQTSDTEANGMAWWLLDQFSITPKPRIRSITVHPVVTPTGTATTAILGLELGAVVTVNRHTLPGAGTAFAQTCNVEGINHHIDPSTGDWNVLLELTPLAPLRPWILGTSQLGVDTTLFF